jgi:hypothetical protein
LRKIQQREGESSWEYSHKFKYSIGRLVHPIHEEHQRKWYIQGLLPLTRIMLTQQWIATLADALEKSMKIEAMAGYLGSLRVTRPLENANLAQLQGQIISTYREGSRIDDTQTKMIESLVYLRLHKRTFGERMSTNEGNGTSSKSDGTLTRTHGRSCESICEFTIPYPNPVSCFSR